MKCLVCGEGCKWLYYPKTEFPRDYYESDFIQTNLWYCPECEHVYRQWIQTKVHRDKVEPIMVGEEK